MRILSKWVIDNIPISIFFSAILNPVNFNTNFIFKRLCRLIDLIISESSFFDHERNNHLYYIKKLKDYTYSAFQK